MPQHRLTEMAQSDLSEIWAYIAKDSPQNADSMTDAIIDRFPRLAEQPFMGRARPELAPDIRSFPVENYIILYRPTDFGVEIARVVHGSRQLESLFIP
jgi:toxin ParE1/3/4